MIVGQEVFGILESIRYVKKISYAGELYEIHYEPVYRSLEGDGTFSIALEGFNPEQDKIHITKLSLQGEVIKNIGNQGKLGRSLQRILCECLAKNVRSAEGLSPKCAKCWVEDSPENRKGDLI